MDLVNLLISLVSGAVGGNIAGALMKNVSLGTAGNSFAGILGGGIGSFVLQALGSGGAAAASAGMGSILGDVAGGGIGGGVLMLIVGMIKNAMATK